MRVLFCKFHCPFICFCKSPHPYFSPCPLKLENTEHVSSSLSSLGNDMIDGEIKIVPKSSLKKPSDLGSKIVENKRVQWIDVLGKELAEIKEFEPSESGELEDDGDDKRGCVCVIQ
ncbi:uncharacterized protein LOC143885135 [Tasmannia lanceolata]|uniref:uncharacterized protein LOC143885135 n=1 Tax=Tasmannia lanceolata TaxID=3420 RepID=UPI004064B566